MSDAPPPARALVGIRVLDLTRLLPGPVATLILADMGAQVDKLEDPGAGDYLRHMPPDADGVNAVFRTINRDKRFCVVDLKKPDGAGVLRRMLGSYDVLIESFRPGVLERLGLSHHALLQMHPRLVIAAITGYGQTGPLAQRAGHDINYLARAGVLAHSGPSASPPAISGAQMADIAGGAMWAVIGILGALHRRSATGHGGVVDVSMTEGSIPLASFAIASALAAPGFSSRGEGPITGGIAPYGTYRTKDDRFVALGALEPKFWIAFCSAAGIEPSLDALMPGAHQAEWRARLESLFAERTRDEWAAVGAAHDCCLEPVLDANELATDPQHAHRGVFHTADGVVYFRTPVGTRAQPETSAGAPGRDTNAVLADCGFSEAEVTALRAQRIVA